MADDFMTGGVCGGGSWWNPARSMFGASPCSAASINDMGNFAWANNNDDHHHHHHNQLVNMKGRSSEESSEGSSVVLQELPKSHHHQTHNMSMDNSTLHMLGIGLSPSSTATTDWNQALVVQTNERAMLQEDRNSRLNYGQEIGVECSDSSFKQIVAKDFSNSNPSVTNFAPSYNNYPSNLLQTLLDSDPQPQQQQPLLSNQQISYAPAPANFRPNLNDFSPPLLKPTFPASFWNQSPASLNDGRAAFLPSTQSQFLPSVFSDKSKPSRKSSNVEEARQSSAMAKKASNEEPAFKRPRIETPSPLPTFKAEVQAATRHQQINNISRLSPLQFQSPAVHLPSSHFPFISHGSRRHSRKVAVLHIHSSHFSSRGRSSSPFHHRKPSSPFSSYSSSSSFMNGKLIPCSSSSSNTSFYGSTNGYSSRSMTPSRNRSGSANPKSYGSRTPVHYPSADELLAEPLDASRSGESISVTVRFRPMSEREYQRGDENAWYPDGDKVVRNDYNPAIAYAFDRVFGQDTSTQEVYEVAARPVVKAAMEGINVHTP